MASTAVTMPQLGESVTEGTVGRWLKRVGEPVKKYESLVEIITDKVNAEVPAPVAGVLTAISAAEGATVAVGTEICVIETEAGARPAAAGAPPAEPQAAAPAAPAAVAAAGDRPPVEADVRLSPAVRALAEEHQVDIGRIRGTGLGGRVTKNDVLDYVAAGLRDRAAVAASASPRAEAPAPSAPPAGAVRVAPRPGDEHVKLTPMRRSIAEHMARSKGTAPHAWTVAEVDMTAVVRARQAARDEFRRRVGADLTYVPFVIKAVVDGLRKHAILNAAWGGDHIVVRGEINIGVAVSVDDGLVVPVIHHADEKSIAGLAKALDDLAGRARAGKLTLEDVQGGTFTVNNPGTFGNVLSYAIINQPQAAILSMEAIVKRPVVVDDAIAIRSMMNLCLSFDHRVLDGVSAARFLQGVRQWLEGFHPGVPLY
jgi:2-oxoisovalerate dehydrogenase E2 component (dihydrolipoyl transacylase)